MLSAGWFCLQGPSATSEAFGTAQCVDHVVEIQWSRVGMLLWSQEPPAPDVGHPKLQRCSPSLLSPQASLTEFLWAPEMFTTTHSTNWPKESSYLPWIPPSSPKNPILSLHV